MRWGSVVLAVFFAASVRAAPDDDAIRKARDETYQKLEVQRELPRGDDRAAPPPQASPGESAEPAAHDDGGGSAIGSTILWILIGAVAVIVVANGAAALLESRRRPRRQAAHSDAEPTPPPEPLPDAFLAAAEAQASQGDYAEAIHGLLLATLTELARRDRATLRPSWTSREVLARTALGQGARTALRDLIASVETSHFGAAVVGPVEFARCRDRYRDFAAAYAEAA